ncbi:MAG: C45 family peptidase [Bacteroidota bacterium]
MKKFLIWYFIIIVLLSAVSICSIKSYLTINLPKVNLVDTNLIIVKHFGDSMTYCGKSWLHKSNTGLFELYTEGAAYERGLVIGKLSRSLIYKQEKAFVDQIHKMVPSDSYLRFLRLLLAVFNRKIDTYVKSEYLQEIDGISQFASDDFNEIGNKYQRILNYHAAHDIGHMLQNYHLVGCTSFAVWGEKSEDSSLLIGRNFDFYVGDEFAEDKIVEFIKPDSGYKFMMITWGGMAGVVSGMNDKGLTVTLNAAKSSIPIHIATPISLVARHILQYAKNIAEAKKISESYTTFVSESLLIGSAEDKQAFIIEKSPYKTDIVSSDSNYLVCTNHFQGSKFVNDEQNIAQQLQTPTTYRYERSVQLLNQTPRLNEKTVAAILRNPYGMNDARIGYTNEMAINQYIAHHSVIFKPEKLLVWISTGPYQLGTYVCYDINKMFSLKEYPPKQKEFYEIQLSLQPDYRLLQEYYCNVLWFKNLKTILLNQIQNKTIKLDEILLTRLCQTNPDYYQTYSLIGDLYFSRNNFNKALQYYTLADEKQVPFYSDKQFIKQHIESCKKLINKTKN